MNMSRTKTKVAVFFKKAKVHHVVVVVDSSYPSLDFLFEFEFEFEFEFDAHAGSSFR